MKNLDVDGLVIGGLKSKYQKKRFEKVYNALSIKMVAPLWHTDVLEMMKVAENFDCTIVKVSVMGLTEEWLSRKIDLECLEDLIKLNEKYAFIWQVKEDNTRRWCWMHHCTKKNCR